MKISLLTSFAFADIPDVLDAMLLISCSTGRPCVTLATAAAAAARLGEQSEEKDAIYQRLDFAKEAVVKKTIPKRQPSLEVSDLMQHYPAVIQQHNFTGGSGLPLSPACMQGNSLCLLGMLHYGIQLGGDFKLPLLYDSESSN